MKTTITSFGFPPPIGQIETLLFLLGYGLSTESCEVKMPIEKEEIVNNTYQHEVIRKPKSFKIIKAILWSDIIFQNNLSARYFWINFFIKYGLSYKKNDNPQLSKIIMDLDNKNKYLISSEKINSQLKIFYKEKVCRDYLRVFKKVLKTFNHSTLKK